jgi:hypothetical protein
MVSSSTTEFNQCVPRGVGPFVVGWLVIAWLVLVSLAASAAPPGASLETILVEEIGRRLPAGTSLDSRDARDITMVTSVLTMFAFYAPDERQIQTSVTEALSAAPADADSLQLTAIALDALFRGYGHQSEFIDLQRPRDKDLQKVAPPHRRPNDIDGLRIVKIDHFVPTSWDDPEDCSGLVDLLTADVPVDIEGMILDLRGNEGGSLAQIACAASPFVAHGTPFFHVENKKTASSSILVPDTAAPSITVPLILLVDEHTDSGGMLFAASMQSLDRATLVGTQRDVLNGNTYNLINVVPQRYQVKIPMGFVRRADGRPLVDGVRIDVSSTLDDQAEVLRAARSGLGLQGRGEKTSRNERSAN